MNIKNKLIAAVMALPFLAGLTACSDEHAEYTPADKVAGSQVYFSSEQTRVSAFEVTDKDNSLSLVLSRAVKEGDLMVKLVADQGEETVFQIPETVSFKDGEATTDVTVTFDASKLVYDKAYKLSLSFADDSYSTPYGTASYSFTITKPAPWTPWCSNKAEWVKAGMDPNAWPLSESASTCNYYYKGDIFKGEDPGLPILYRQSTLDPTQAQIRIDHWGYDVSLVLEFNPETNKIQVLPQYTGFTEDGYGDFYVTDVTHWQSKDYYANYPCQLDRETGRIVLNTAYLADNDPNACYGYGAEYIQLDGFYIPDYSINMDYMGILTDKNQTPYAQIMVDFGVDAKTVKGFVCEKEADADAVADAIAAGEVDAVDLVKGLNNLPLGDYVGELQVVAVGINEGEIVNVSTVQFEYYGGGQASPWKSLGTGLFTDDIVITQYVAEVDEAGNPTKGFDPVTYPVEIMENTENPGLYRVMNPYSNSVYPMAEDDCAPDGYYLEVNATDPEFVYVLTQYLGFDEWFGEGPLYFVSEAGRYVEQGYDREILERNGIFGGTLKNGEITFPVFRSKSGAEYQGILFCGEDNGYYTGVNGAIKVVLPEAVNAAAMAKAKMNAKGIAALKFGNRIAPKKMKASHSLFVDKKVGRLGKRVTLK